MTQIERRQLWTAIHRYSGLFMLLFLAIAAATGCVLSFEKPLDAWLNPELFSCTTSRPIDPATAAGALERAHPELAATTFPVRAEPGRTVEVLVEPRGAQTLSFDQVFLDCRDGHVVGTRRTEAGWGRAHLMRGVYLLHYTLLAGDWGRWLMGVVALVWLLSNLVGVYLTWPLRRPWFRQWKRIWQFRRSSPLPRLLLDIHRASGLWLLLPLSVLAFTSVAMNFFSEAFLPAVQLLSPPRPSPFDGAPAGHKANPPAFPDLLRKAELLAARRQLTWQPAVYQREPVRGLSGLRFTPSGIEEYRALGPVTYWFDDATGTFVYEDSPYADSAGQALSRALFPLHTGQMIGWPGIVLDLILGLATLEMCGTALYLWLKRRPGRVSARKRERGKARSVRD
ncbi:PepSY-associated TM helix domain-containing protein [Sphingomonas oligophenolica]|uniref:PepSY-associated TM helix domain-containing protein n=1 Tax=Sphingomonas oligophenolica TaxID=301154 RepID=A0ABU9Y8E8_9SPHN